MSNRKERDEENTERHHTPESTLIDNQHWTASKKLQRKETITTIHNRYSAKLQK